MIVKNFKNEEDQHITFDVEIDAETFDAAVQKSYIKNKKDINVPGFRKGKAPRMVIEGMYGAKVFYEDAYDELAPEAFAAAVEEQDAHTVGQPTVTNIEVNDDKVLTFSFKAALFPTVTLGQYKGIEGERADDTVTDADVDSSIEDARTRNGRQVTVERAAKLGDTVNLDYKGFMGDDQFEGGTADGQDLTLGDGKFIPGFEDGVVGMKAGEEKDITVTFPENYAPELSGKEAVFKITVNEVCQLELPELDDEFVKDVSEFDNMADYRANIRETLEKQKKDEVDSSFYAEVMKKAIENMTVEVPTEMVEERMGVIVQDYERSLSAQGMHLEQYLRMVGMDPLSFDEYIRPQAIEQVKNDLLLENVAEAEKIEISDEDVDKTIADIAEAYHMPADQIGTYLPKDSIIHDMKMRRAAEIIRDSAVAVPVSEKKDEAEAAAEEKPKKRAPAKKKAESETAEAPAEADAAAEEKPKKKVSSKKKAEAEEEPTAE